jgi:phosphoribosyl-AMP cyclohydrolase
MRALSSCRFAPHPAAPKIALMTQDNSEMATQAVLNQIRFDANGLVPAIAQQHDTGEVLMLAWLNRDSLTETLATGRVCYYSRSRKALWRKGETSGQTQHLKELRIDCDGDTVLLLVEQDGVACHTGRRSCFYRALRDGALVEIAQPLVSPERLYGTVDSK